MLNRISVFKSVLAVVLVFASVSLAGAPLADHVPGDALLYIGWAGADSQSAAYQASDLSAFIDHSNLPDVARQYLQMFLQHVNANNNAGDRETVATFQKMLPLLWRHPTAIYEALPATPPDAPVPDNARMFINPLAANISLICDAGADAAQLQTDLQSIIKGDPHVHLTVSDGVVTIGMTKVDEPLATPLSVNPRFVATLQKLQPSPAFAVYVDAKAILTKANDSAASDENVAEIWPKVRDALGITNVKTFAMTAGFDGTNWMTASLLEAPNPRTGLLAAFEPKPIDPALLARIPATAGSVSLYNLDLAKLVDTIGDAMATTPQSDQAFHQGIGIATVALGANFRRQIIGPLGPQWVVYSDSDLHSVVLMNHPNDPKTESDAAVSVVFGLVNLANSQIHGAATQPVVNAVQTTVKKVDVTSAVTKIASPSVAVKDGMMYLGLSPEAVVTSATLPGSAPAADLMHSANFLAAVKRLGVSNFDSFTYCDLPSTAPKAYDNFGTTGAQLQHIMEMVGVQIPKIELPPIDQLKMHLSPALAVSWADENGIYGKSISPFPGAMRLLGDPEQNTVSATAISALASIAAPALQRSRSQAQSVEVMNQERQILMGIMMYATDHQGQFPPDLGSLVSEGEIDGTALNIFLNPVGDVKVPPEISTGTKEQQAAWVVANADFVFLTPNRKSSQPDPVDTVVIIPKDADHATTRVPIGFADGHVETCTPLHAKKLLHPDQN